MKNFPTSFIFVVLLGTHFMDYCSSTKELSFWIEVCSFLLVICMYAGLLGVSMNKTTKIIDCNLPTQWTNFFFEVCSNNNNYFLNKYCWSSIHWGGKCAIIKAHTGNISFVIFFRGQPFIYLSNLNLHSLNRANAALNFASNMVVFSILVFVSFLDWWTLP